MRSTFCLSSALALVLLPAALMAAPRKGTAEKKSAKEISSDDKALEKQMDWENTVLGPKTEKKIDLAKIQKLQAEEAARREKQAKIDQADKDKKDREAAQAARKDVKAPSSREVPEIEETPPPPPKPVEKHDDAFVDKLLKDKGTTKKKSAQATNDEVDQLLNQSKSDKPAAGKSSKKGGDTVDQLLASTDNQQTIKTTPRKPIEASEPVSAEAAARAAALKAIQATAAANASEERERSKKPAIPDASVLRAQMATNNGGRPTAMASRPTPATTTRSAAPAARSASWNDPFANEAEPAPRKGKTNASVTASAPSASGRRAPAVRPASESWQDPFDAGSSSGAKTRPSPKAAPAAPAKPSKKPANWKDPFA